MGLYAGIIVCDLKKRGKGIIPLVNVVVFKNDTWVTWQSGKLPNKEMIEKGCKTIYFKKIGKKQEIEYPAHYMVTPVTYAVFGKKREGFFFQTDFHLFDRGTLLHVVLPYQYVPDSNSFEGREPQFTKKRNKHISITWTFRRNIRAKFYFYKDKEEYRKFKTLGNPIEVKIDPRIKNSLNRKAIMAKKVGSEFKDFAAEVMAKTILGISNLGKF